MGITFDPPNFGGAPDPPRDLPGTPPKKITFVDAVVAAHGDPPIPGLEVRPVIRGEMHQGRVPQVFSVQTLQDLSWGAKNRVNFGVPHPEILGGACGMPGIQPGALAFAHVPTIQSSSATLSP